MNLMNRNRQPLSILLAGAILTTITITPVQAEYNPKLGRFMQRDPNQTAMLLTTALAVNGQTRDAFVSLSPRSQYNDGLHLYAFVRGNPITGVDPSGRAALLLKQGTTIGIGATMYAALLSAMGGAKAWMLRIIGRMVAYTYVQSVAAIAAGSAGTIQGVDIAALSVVESDLANWLAGQTERDAAQIRQGYSEYFNNSASGSGPGRDPNKWREFLDFVERAFRKPNASDPKLQRIYEQMWRANDTRPGGTIGELRREVMEGVSLDHLQKAQQGLAGLINRLADRSTPLSRADHKGAEKVIQALRDAIKFAETWTNG